MGNRASRPSVPAPAIIPPLSPEKDLARYTRQRLEQGLEFVRCRFENSRHITPRTEKALEMYEDSILQAITTSDEGIRLDCMKEIRGMEKLMSTKAVFRGGLSEQFEQLQLQILQFREFEYHARYGAYLGLPLASLGCSSGLHQTPGHEHLSGEHRWTKIAEHIREERKAEADWMRLTAAEKALVSEPATPRTTAVFTACQSLGFDPIRMLWAIVRYAERNMTVHADISDMIKNCQWIELGEVVYRDLQEIHFLLPRGREEDTEHLQAILEGLLDTYLDRSHGHRDRPQTWAPNKYAVAEFSKRVAAASEAAVLRERRAFAAQQKEAKKLRQLNAGKQGTINTNGKRLASTEAPRGSEREMTMDQKRQKKRILVANRLALDVELEKLKDVED